jgi:hemerythrin
MFYTEVVLMFEWKDAYSTGIPEIDEQHKMLFQIARKAYDLLKNDIYIDKYDRIVEIIEELKDYTIFHFKAEEEYMMKIGYRKFLSHKVQHDEFIKKISDIDFSRVDDSQNSYLMELLEFVYQWIDQHILKTDKQYTL